jgi:hypothetical protein
MGQGETCYNCVYSHWDRNQAAWTFMVGMPVRPVCGNQPDFPGRMRTCATGPVCRNFRPRPPTPTGATVKTIPLGDGFYAYVDAADYEWLSRWKWHFHGGYAIRCEGKKMVYMHRQIMEPPEGMVVDHKNHNKLDNTRANLRVCTPRENRQNTAKAQGTSSRFKGVSHRRHEDKWYAGLDWQGKQLFLGSFAEEIEAARARDYKAVQLLGEDAWVNLPEEWPPQRRREVHARWLATEGKRKKEEGRKRKGKKRKVKGKKPKAAPAGTKTKPAKPRAKDAGRKAKGVRRKTEKRK